MVGTTTNETSKRELLTFFREGQKDIVLWKLKRYREVAEAREDFYELVGELLRADPSYFMDDFYEPFLKQIFYQKNLLPYDSREELFEMERYLIERYSFYPDEQLLTCFNGRIVQENPYPRRRYSMIHNIVQVSGRIYFTNYRVIAHGRFGQNGRWHSMVQSKERPEPCYGYQFPITLVKKPRKLRKRIKYRVPGILANKNQFMQRKYRISIHVKKMPLESKKEYNKKKEKVLEAMMQELRAENGQRTAPVMYEIRRTNYTLWL